jgi:archaellum biogenesis ATPase FlaH
MHSPQEIRLRYALQTTPIFWISNHGTRSVNPIDLEVIADITIKFLKQSKNPVVLLDGIEHLIFENGSAPVLRLLRDIEEWIILQRAILILPVNPAAIEKKELALIERNMNELRPNSNEERANE